MLICSNCESPQFLQIISSRVYFSDGEDTPSELEEYYQCTLCSSEGRYEVWTENGTKRTSIRGEIEETEERPKAEI